MLLASPSAHAPRSKNRLLGETEHLGELKPALGLGFDIHRVPAVENAGDIHAFGAGHTVPATGTVHALVCTDLGFDLLDQSEVLLSEGAWPRLARHAAVFPDHVQRISLSLLSRKRPPWHSIGSLNRQDFS